MSNTSTRHARFEGAIEDLTSRIPTQAIDDPLAKAGLLPGEVVPLCAAAEVGAAGSRTKALVRRLIVPRVHRIAGLNAGGPGEIKWEAGFEGSGRALLWLARLDSPARDTHLREYEWANGLTSGVLAALLSAGTIEWAKRDPRSSSERLVSAMLEAGFTRRELVPVAGDAATWSERLCVEGLTLELRFVDDRPALTWLLDPHTDRVWPLPLAMTPHLVEFLDIGHRHRS